MDYYDALEALVNDPAGRAARLIRESAQLRAAMEDPQLRDPALTRDLSLAQLISKIFQTYSDRPALGMRDYEIIAHPETAQTVLRHIDSYRTLTYAEVASRRLALASAFLHVDGLRLRPAETVAMLGFGSADYLTADLACMHIGAVPVPLQPDLPAETLAILLEELEPRCLVASVDNVDKAADLLCGLPARYLIVMDYEERDDRQRDLVAKAAATLEKHGKTLALIGALIDHGGALEPAPEYVPDEGENPLATILYTSGSTGTPKGAMFRHDQWRPWWQQFSSVPMIIVGFLPFNHGIGRATPLMALSCGGTCYFAARNDMSTLFDDFRLARPTKAFLIPRVAGLIFEHFQMEVSRRVKQGLDPEKARHEASEWMRDNFLGGQLMVGFLDSAPTPPEVVAFLRDAFEITILEQYGSTEAGGITVNGQVVRPPIIDYRLIDVPELGYFSSDRPFPRGELRVKTTWPFYGYYKHPELTAQARDSDGYFITGDIVEERGPDRLAVIGRRNNVIKLAQGEHVALGHLEAIFASAPAVDQIYLYGDSTKSYLLAVVVPNMTAARQELGVLPDSEKLKAWLRESLERAAKEADLRAFERPRDFIVEPQPFSTSNGLLTSLGKNVHPVLKSTYGKRLDEMYASLESRRDGERDSVKDVGGDLGTIDRVKICIEAVLGLSDLQEADGQSFVGLGGDSLAAMSFSLMLTEAFDQEVPVNVILEPSTTIRDLADYIDGKTQGTSTALEVKDVHQDKNEIRAADLELRKFLPDALLEAATVAQSVRTPARTVFVTGATGFLGRFQCLEWLERLVPANGKVICLVRAADDQAARERLMQVFNQGDASLFAHFQSLAAKGLEVVAGDIALPNLGLAQATWDRLAEEVDQIVHSAASTNHILPYSGLFEPNVVGTANIIGLALATRLKRLDYVSTTSVCFLNQHLEDRDFSARDSYYPWTLGYAHGYGLSKWAGEVLSREAHDRFGMPLAIFRPCFLLAHSSFVGQVNQGDVITRLLRSIGETGLAPYSFHRLTEDGKRASKPFMALTVDFAAKAITAIGADGQRGFAIYNLDNRNRDSASLDDAVDAMKASFDVELVRDYGTWVDRMEERLLAMPANDRMKTVFPVLRSFYGFSGSTEEGDAVHISPRSFHNKIRELRLDPSGEAPKVTPALFQKFAHDIKLMVEGS